MCPTSSCGVTSTSFTCMLCSNRVRTSPSSVEPLASFGIPLAYMLSRVSEDTCPKMSGAILKAKSTVPTIPRTSTTSEVPIFQGIDPDRSYFGRLAKTTVVARDDLYMCNVAWLVFFMGSSLVLLVLGIVGTFSPKTAGNLSSGRRRYFSRPPGTTSGRMVARQ